MNVSQTKGSDARPGEEPFPTPQRAAGARVETRLHLALTLPRIMDFLFVGTDELEQIMAIQKK